MSNPLYNPEIFRLYSQDPESLNTNTVLFIMLLKQPIIIRVHNQEAADSFRTYFETLWQQARP